MKIITILLLFFSSLLTAQTSDGFDMNAFLKDISTEKYHKIKKVSAQKLKWEKEEFACGFMCADWCTYIYIIDPKTGKWKQFARFACISA
jgi:hypothetical protein